MDKKTVVIGASMKKHRFSNRAVQMLVNNNIEVIPIGISTGKIAGVEIIKANPEIKDIHTITMYIGKHLQSSYYDYIISLNPKRIIFNPGSENPDFEIILNEKKINFVHDCTIVMLMNGEY